MKRSLLYSVIAVAALMIFTQASMADGIDLVSDGGSYASSDAIGHVTINDDGTTLKIKAMVFGGHVDIINKDTDPASELRNLHITGAHIHVSTDEPDDDWDGKTVKNGNPRPGHFEYCHKPKSSPRVLLFGSPVVGYKTAILTIPSPDTVAYVAIHLEISGDLYVWDSDISDWVEDGTSTETAWAGEPEDPVTDGWGEDFDGANWATYFSIPDPTPPLAPGNSSTAATAWGAIKAK